MVQAEARVEVSAAMTRVSMLRLFGIAFVLPFARPVHMVACGVIPGIALLAGCLLAPGLIAVGGAPGLGVKLSFSDIWMSTPSSPIRQLSSLPAVAWTVRILSLGLFAAWLCAWQRGAALDFREPLGTWLRRSLMRLPIYTVVLVGWLALPVIVGIPSLLLIGWSAEGGFLEPILGGGSELGYWLAMAIVFVLLVPIAWAFSRLSPWPAVAVAFGFRGSFGRAWRIGRSHNIGMALSIVGYYLVATALDGFGAAFVPILFRAGFDAGYAVYFQSIALTNFVATSFFAFWCTSFGGLLVRDSMAVPIDPATFD